MSRKARFFAWLTAALVLVCAVVAGWFIYKRATKPPLHEWLVGSWYAEAVVLDKNPDGTGKPIHCSNLIEFRSDGTMFWHTRVGADLSSKPPGEPWSHRWEVLGNNGDQLTVRIKPPSGEGVVKVYTFVGKDSFTSTGASVLEDREITYHRVGTQP